METDFIKEKGLDKASAEFRNSVLYRDGPIAPLKMRDEEKRFDITIHPSPSSCTDCAICQFHFESPEQQKFDSIAYHHHVSDTDAQDCISELLQSIEKSRLHLRSRLQTHGDNFLKRWQKLGQKALLDRLRKFDIEQKAWPQLHRYLHFDLGWHEKRQHRRAFLVPQINAEALSKDTSRFLRLVHHRTTHMPADFFWDDMRALIFPVSQGLLEKTFNSSCMVTNGGSRGTLVPWDRDQMHDEQICGFPVAKIVLESQDLLMRTICTMFDGMVGDLKVGSGNKKWDAAAHGNYFLDAAESDRRYPILEEPYGPPPKDQIPDLKGWVYLREETLMDHIVDLETDPLFMQETMHDMTSARQVLESGQASKKAQNRFWVSAARDVWLWDYIRVIDWGEFVQHLNLVQDADENRDGECSARLYVIIASAWNSWIQSQAERCLQNFPGVVVPRAEETSAETVFELRPEFERGTQRRALFTKDRLLWALLELFVCSYSLPRENVDVTTLLSVLADELNNPKQRARLDTKSSLLVDDLLAIHLVFRAITSHGSALPSVDAVFNLGLQAPTYDEEVAKRRRGAQLERAFRGIYLAEKHLQLATQTGNTLKEVYNAKWPKGKPSEAWLPKVNAAHARLRDFWDSWRVIGRLAINSIWDNAYDTQKWRLINLMQCDLLPEHQGNIKQEELAIRSAFEQRPAKRKSRPDSIRLAEPAESIPHSAEPTPAKKFEPPQKKQKQKTTRAPALEVDAEPQEASPPPSPVSPDLPKILVSKKSFDVLERMFPSDSGNFKEGTVRFRDVEGVLADAGLAIEQGQGSAVTFKQEADEAGRPAVRFSIHRPHRQGDVVDGQILRRIGYRLRDRLGWRWKQFGVRGKET